MMPVNPNVVIPFIWHLSLCDIGRVKLAKISIITPVWNGMPYLKTCVESVLAQDFGDWELLISNDGSTDGSAEYLSGITDSRVKLFNQKTNLGIFGNLNFLFAKASSPVSQILCQDDYMLNSTSLRALHNMWRDAPSRVGFMRANWSVRHARSSLERLEGQILPRIIEPQDSDLVFFICGCVVGNLSNASMRTNLVRDVGWFNQDFPYAGDFEFWSRAGRQVPFSLESKDITFVRSHPGQASIHLNRQGELISQLYAVVDGLFERLKGRAPIWLLRAHATATYDASHRWIAVLNFIRRADLRYLQQVNVHASQRETFLPSVLRWLLFFFTAGGRLGRTLAAKVLLRSAMHRPN